MKVSFYNIGCKVNYAEMAQIQEQFESLGHVTVPFGEKADACFIHTCTVTHNADADSRKYIRRARRNNPDAFVGVMGCYAQLKPEEIGSIDGIDAVFGMKEKFMIPQLLEGFERQDSTLFFVGDLKDIPFEGACSAEDASHTRVVLKIQDGCDYFCTYCAVPHARGRSRSMEFDKVRSYIKGLDDSGYHEIVLSGINLGDYKHEGKTFTDVARMINNLDISLRVRISSIEPNLITNELIDIVAERKNLCPHFHIPLQSGSDNVLKIMRRRYDSALFAEKIELIKGKIPDCGIGADVIVGSPGEAEYDFARSYKLLESLPLSYLHVFTYSERDVTAAAGFEGKVSPADKKTRTHALRELSEKMRIEFYESQLGTTQRAVPERYNSETGLWDGWTDNYVQVLFPGDPASKAPLNVELKSIQNGKIICL